MKRQDMRVWNSPGKCGICRKRIRANRPPWLCPKCRHAEALKWKNAALAMPAMLSDLEKAYGFSAIARELGYMARGHASELRSIARSKNAWTDVDYATAGYWDLWADQLAVMAKGIPNGK